MPHELFLTARQTTKVRNAFENNVKFSKAQICKIIQNGGSFGPWLANLRNKALTTIAIPLASDNLPGLASNLTSNAINKFERKISE